MRAPVASGLLMLSFVVASGQVHVKEDVLTSTVWEYASSPYIIQNDITVADGCTLTIEPGVRVSFGGPYWLQTDAFGAVITANGKIDINGTNEDRKITFAPNIGGTGGRSGMGVKIVSSDASSFEFCVFYGQWHGLALEESDVSVFGSRFSNCDVGIYCVDSSPSISNTDFFSCNTAVRLSGRDSSPTIRSTNFIENHVWNIYLQDYAPPPLTIDARECYWRPGGAHAIIEESIYHDIDDPGIYGHVDFSDWLNESPVEQTSWGRVKALFR